ncbi:hypothetical protein FA15DRAFT_702315 [Coprinopsis marcescibilis]|uniref:Uncharacterized protein n=1 Tax=Coprinopsis marcescibilis TaxID=230819 RepID=A0A5C3L2P0_COPMA|nr:hypothetical protein FA15DRAFT_702315 [Coprinopsis marcescibilis]
MSLLRALSNGVARQLQAASRLSTHRPSPLLRVVPAQRCRTFWGGPKPESTSDVQNEVNDKAKEIMAKFVQSEEWKKIAQHPPAVEAIQKFMNVIGSKGLSMQPNQPPKLREMMKLAMDPEFRDALNRMKTEIKNAGVDIDNPEFIQSLMGAGGGGSSQGLFPWSK